MGGLRKTMPWTYVTFLIGSLSLAGIWPLAGFWSKDEILGAGFNQQPCAFHPGHHHRFHDRLLHVQGGIHDVPR